jgi:hypothetical protein
MGGDTLAAMEHLDGARGDAHIARNERFRNIDVFRTVFELVSALSGGASVPQEDRTEAPQQG